MVKVRKVSGQELWMAKCPGCGNCHGFDSRWTFNGNVDNPTFFPSFLTWHEHGDPPQTHRCHSFLTDGHWVYLDDCTHALKGQRVEVPEW